MPGKEPHCTDLIVNPHHVTHLPSTSGKQLDPSELRFSQLQSGFCTALKILDTGMHLLPNGYGGASGDSF